LSLSRCVLRVSTLLTFVSFAWDSAISAKWGFTINGTITWSYPSSSIRFVDASKKTLL